MALALLFGQVLGSRKFQNNLNNITDEINSKSDEFILGVNFEEWKEYFFDKYSFTPLIINDAQTSLDAEKKRSMTGLQYYVLKLSVPFNGSSDLFFLKPASSVVELPQPEADIPNGCDSGRIVYAFNVEQPDPNKARLKKDKFLNSLKQNVEYINRDVIEYNSKICLHVEEQYDRGRKTIFDEHKFFEALNIKIQSATDKISKVPIEKRKIPEPVVDKKSGTTFSHNPYCMMISTKM
jgi:hypothetical protein